MEEANTHMLWTELLDSPLGSALILAFCIRTTSCSPCISVTPVVSFHVKLVSCMFSVLIPTSPANDDGSGPAGKDPDPASANVSSAASWPMLSLRTDGIPGVVNCSDVTTPVPAVLEQPTPAQLQKFVSVSQPPGLVRLAWAEVDAAANMSASAQNWRRALAVELSAVESAGDVGAGEKSGAQVEHGKEVGAMGALRVYWERQADISRCVAEVEVDEVDEERGERTRTRENVDALARRRIMIMRSMIKLRFLRPLFSSFRSSAG